MSDKGEARREEVNRSTFGQILGTPFGRNEWRIEANFDPDVAKFGEILTPCWLNGWQHWLSREPSQLTMRAAFLVVLLARYESGLSTEKYRSKLKKGDNVLLGH